VVGMAISLPVSIVGDVSSVDIMAGKGICYTSDLSAAMNNDESR